MKTHIQFTKICGKQLEWCLALQHEMRALEKKEDLKINHLSSHLRKLEKEEQIQPNASRRKRGAGCALVAPNLPLGDVSAGRTQGQSFLPLTQCGPTACGTLPWLWEQAPPCFLGLWGAVAPPPSTCHLSVMGFCRFTLVPSCPPISILPLRGGTGTVKAHHSPEF